MPPIPQPTIDTLWEQMQPHLKTQLGAHAFGNWFSQVDISVKDSSADEITLICPSRFVKDWVQNRYTSHILRAAQQAGSTARFVRFSVCKEAPQQTHTPNLTPKTTPAAPVKAYNRKRQKHYVLDQFVVGSSNRLAHSSITSLIEQQGHLIGANPLILHGGVGLGKTHLLQAAARELQAQGLRVTYLSAEQFMYEFVSALQKKDMAVFKNNFRNGDVLLMDDIQFLCGKQSTQEEFQHTLNAMIDADAQLVLSCNNAPQHLDGLDERVRSRMAAGLVVELHAPNSTLIAEIAQQKAQALGMALPDNVIDFIAQHITRNIREVEGAINRLYAHQHLLGNRITPEAAADILQHFVANATTQISITQIKQQVSNETGVSLKDIDSARRQRDMVRARQLAMYLCKQLTKESYPTIARHFGNRDHATVIHAVKRTEHHLKTDTALQSLLKKVQNAL